MLFCEMLTTTCIITVISWKTYLQKYQFWSLTFVWNSKVANSKFQDYDIQERIREEMKALDQKWQRYNDKMWREIMQKSKPTAREIFCLQGIFYLVSPWLCPV